MRGKRRIKSFTGRFILIIIIRYISILISRMSRGISILITRGLHGAFMAGLFIFTKIEIFFTSVALILNFCRSELSRKGATIFDYWIRNYTLLWIQSIIFFAFQTIEITIIIIISIFRTLFYSIRMSFRGK